jgi:hypothetical protein
VPEVRPQLFPFQKAHLCRLRIREVEEAEALFLAEQEDKQGSTRLSDSFCHVKYLSNCKK